MTTTRIDDNQSRAWAQERTLLDLVRETAGTNAILLEYSKQALSESKFIQLQAALAGQQDDLSDEENATRTRIHVDDKKHRDLDSLDRDRAMRDLGFSFKSGLSDLASGLDTAKPGSMFATVTNRLQSVNNSFEGLDTTLGRVIGTATKIAVVFNAAYTRIDQMNSSFLDAYKSGVIFQDGLYGLNKIVGESGMSMQDFVGIMVKYSQSFNVLGSKTVSALNKEFRTLTKNGSGLMMSLQESQEGLMAYTDILRLSGRLQRTSVSQVASGAKTYLESINQLSAASGRARDEILKSSRDAMAQPEFQAFMRTLNDGAKENLELGITSLGTFGADIQNQFKTLIVAQTTGGTAAMYKANTSMYMLASQTGQMAKLMNVIELAKAGKDTSQAMADLTKGIENSPFVQSGSLSRLAQFSPMFADMQKTFGSMATEADNYIQTQKNLDEYLARENITRAEYEKQRDAESKRFQESNAAMQIAMTGLNAVFNDLALTSMPLITVGMDALSGTLSVVNGVLGVFATAVKDLSDFLSSIFSSLGFNESTSASMGAVGAGAAVYAGYKGLGAVKNRLTGGGGVPPIGLPNGPNMPDIPRLSKLGEGLSGFGKGMGGLGKGVGDSVAGVMKGIARGFKAFGDPSVLRGIAGVAGVAGSIWIAAKAFQEFATVEWEDMGKAAVTITALAVAAGAAGTGPLPGFITAGGVALGAAIAAIGAGLAGAAWMLGGTLPGLAEGIRAFTDIDGANLEKVGLGMLGIGAGLLAMGAKDLISAISGFSGWIGSFFEEDPIDRLKRFGELAEPLGKAGPALNAFSTSFLNATARLNAGVINDSVTTSMDQIMSILNMDASGMLGGEPPIIGQINSLADAMNNLNKESVDLMGGGVATAEVQTPGVLSSSDLQKRTLAFYDNQKTSNASVIELLQLANVKLEDLNIAVTDGTYTTARSIRKAGNRV